MLITRYGNEDVVVVVDKSSFCSKTKYTIALCEAEDTSTIPEIKYDEIDDVVGILLEVKKAIEEDMAKDEEIRIASEAQTKEDLIDGGDN